MTEPEQGVKHDARRMRVVIDRSASHMMGVVIARQRVLVQPATEVSDIYITYQEGRLHLIHDPLCSVLRNITKLKKNYSPR